MAAPIHVNWPQFRGFIPLIKHSMRILVILAGAYVLTRIVRKSMPAVHRRIVQFMRSRRAQPGIEFDKRTDTLGTKIGRAHV